MFLESFPVSIWFSSVHLLLPGKIMLIDIHKNRLKKMAKHLRQLSDDFYEIINADDKSNPPKQKVPDVIQLHRRNEIQQIVDHYKEKHPDREKNLKPASVSWKLIDKRLTDGYTAEELVLAIDNNSNPDLCPWWCGEYLHNIGNIMGKESNLDKFINIKPRGGNVQVGHSNGSSSFTDTTEGFGE